MVHTPRLRPLVLLLAALLLFAAGCAGRGGSTENPESKFHQDDEEVVDNTYVPRDDGRPLSDTELQAFRSLGEIDRNLSQEETAIVEAHFKYFVHDHRGTLQRFADRTARYLPYMKKTFTSRGIPEEIIYLSMVESGGNPNAISPAGAAGLWQFMPYTGKQYGLSQNRWIDERRDPFKATYAASDYLLKLHGDFNNWHLAIAAYNAGEGKIGKALAGTGAKDFFELCRLNGNLEERRKLKDETQNYVPRFIAMAKIMRNLKLLGFREPSASEAYDLTPIEIPAGSNLSALAQNLGLTWDEFSGMNPAYRRTGSPPTMPTTAYLPAGQVAQAQTWLASTESRMYAGWREDTVRRGDTLASVAKRNNVPLDALRDANGFTALPSTGASIIIPGKATTQDYAAYDNGASTTKGSAGKYTVSAGDTLYSLAQDWGTSVESIQRTNRLTSNDISVGRRLIIPADARSPQKALQRSSRSEKSASSGGSKTVTTSSRSGAATPAFTGSHTVKAGDTLFSLSRQYCVNVTELCAANKIQPGDTLKAGRKLKVPATTAAAPESKATAQEAKAQPAAKTAPIAAKAPTPAKSDPAAKPAQTAKPTAAKPAKPTASGAKSVQVGAGDTLYSLARKNNISVDELCKANGITSDTKIQVGRKLRIP